MSIRLLTSKTLKQTHPKTCLFASSKTPLKTPFLKSTLSGYSQKRSYQRFVPLNYNDYDGVKRKSYSILRSIGFWLLGIAAFVPLPIYIILVQVLERDKSTKEFISATEDNIIRPLIEKRTKAESVPWFKSLNPNDESDYNEIKLILRAELEASDDLGRFEILNSERPWRDREELKLKQRIEKFMAYPNYYKGTISEVCDVEDENEDEE